MVKYFQISSIIFLTSGLLLLSSCKKSHYFTGTIEYQYTYDSSTLNADSLAKFKPFKSEFRYDTINYQSRFFAGDTMTYYYSGQLGKCISQINSDKKFECEDYRIPTDSIISYKVYETEEKIMGHNCRIIEWQGKYFYNIYYVSTDFKITPGTYKEHVSYNWKFYGEKTGGGLILKSEHRFKNYTMKGSAVNIKEDVNDFKAFNIDNKSFEINCE